MTDIDVLKTSIYKVLDKIKDIQYGFYDKNTGKLINDRQWIHDCDNLSDYYSVQYDPEKTINSKWGICQDQSIAIKYLFNKYYPDIPVQLYSMRMGRFGHCVPTFKYNDVWYYLENAWDKEMGIHGPFDNEDAVREYLKNLYIKHHGEETTEVPIVDTYEIKEPIQESFIELLETRSNDKVSGVSDKESEEVEVKPTIKKSDNAVYKQKIATRSNSRTKSVVTDVEDSKESDIGDRPNKSLTKKFKNEQKIAEVSIKSPNSKKPIIGRSSTAENSESHYTRTNDSVEYTHTYDKNDPKNSSDALRRKAGKAAMKEYNKQSSDKREQEQYWRILDKYGLKKAKKFADYKLKKKSLSENYDLDEYELLQLLEDCGYEPSDENLEILKEDIDLLEDLLLETNSKHKKENRQLTRNYLRNGTGQWGFGVTHMKPSKDGEESDAESRYRHIANAHALKDETEKLGKTGNSEDTENGKKLAEQRKKEQEEANKSNDKITEKNKKWRQENGVKVDDEPTDEMKNVHAAVDRVQRYEAAENKKKKIERKKVHKDAYIKKYGDSEETRKKANEIYGEEVVLYIPETINLDESFNEYQLMQILDENGFTTTDEDVALLRESLENGTLIVETEE